MAMVISEFAIEHGNMAHKNSLNLPLKKHGMFQFANGRFTGQIPLILLVASITREDQ